MPSDELAGILEELREDPLSAAPTLLDMRAKYEAMAPPVPEGTRTEATRLGGVEIEWVRAESAGDDRAVLFLHGGGYTIGSIHTHRALAARVSAAAGARVALVGYRLAPEAPFPAAFEDAMAAYRRLLAETSPDRTAVVGDSAGGGLALAVLTSAGQPQPAACACLCPWVDLALTGASIRERAARDPIVTPASLEAMARAYLGDTDPRHPRASPLYGTLSGLPPLLIQVGTEEVLFDDAIRLDERARTAGVEVTLERWDGMFHVWHAFGGALPEADQAIRRVGAFLDDALSRAVSS